MNRSPQIKNIPFDFSSRHKMECTYVDGLWTASCSCGHWGVEEITSRHKVTRIHNIHVKMCWDWAQEFKLRQRGDT